MSIARHPALDRVGPWVPALARAGIAAAVVAVGILALMHVVGPSSQIDPVRRTISEYAVRDGGWAFELAVVILALGSAGVVAALVATGLLPARSATAALLALACLGLVLVVAFEKTNWSVGPSLSGTVHRYASLVSFIGLPVAGLLLARRWRDDGRWRAPRRAARGLSWLALAILVPVAVAIVLRPLTGVPWWRAVPLGLVERAVSLTDATLVVVLGLWALRAARRG